VPLDPVRGGRGLDVEQGAEVQVSPEHRDEAVGSGAGIRHVEHPARVELGQARVAAAGAAEWRNFMDATRLAADLEDARGSL
jgi:hypothetical protein